MVIKVTVISDKGRRPVSTLITVKDINDWNAHSKTYKQRALQNICAKKFWDSRDLRLYGYSKIKAEIYTPQEKEEK